MQFRGRGNAHLAAALARRVFVKNVKSSAAFSRLNYENILKGGIRAGAASRCTGEIFSKYVQEPVEYVPKKLIRHEYTNSAYEEPRKEGRRGT